MPVDGDPALYGAVARPRLVALLDEGSRRRLLTVVADAGFGKSTLLGSWAAERPCAWYTVRAEDRSLAAMVTGLVESPAPPGPRAVGGSRRRTPGTARPRR